MQLTVIIVIVILLLIVPFPQIDVIGAVVIVWRVREKISRSVTVQYSVQQLCTVQCTHKLTDLTVVCWLDFAFLWLYCVLQFICVRFSFFGDYFVL